MASLALLLAATLAAAPPPPPSPAPRAPTETRFGVTLEDPDRWLEDQQNPAARAWVEGQAAHTRALLDAIPARAELLADIERLERASTSSVRDLVLMADGRILLLRQPAGRDSAQLYLREGWDGAERLLLDPEDWKAKTGQPHAINYMAPSPDGRLAAVGISAAGSEEATAYVIDLASGEVKGEPISRVLFGVSWLPDGSGFFYNRLNALRPGQPLTERQLDSQAYLHRLGTDPERDPLVFGNRHDEALGIEAPQLPFVDASPDSGFLLGIPYSVDNRLTIFAAPRAGLTEGKLQWRRVVGPEDAVRSFERRGDDLLLLTATTANRRIERLSLATPDAAREIIVPAGLEPIDSLAASADALYWVAMRDSGVGSRLFRLPWGGGTAREVTLPSMDTIIPYAPQEGASGIAVAGAGWARFPDIVRVDAEGVVHPTALQPAPAGIDGDALEARIVQVPSHDGVEVPLSIVHRRGLARDGGNPTLLNGYGAYGMSTEPFLVPAHFAFFDRGFVRAFCHVRGGGEKGEAWYRAGFQASKANTWKDLIACAEYLVREGYTLPAQLAASGGSAGGIMIGNAMIERPDLFGAMIPQVGALDTVGIALRDPNGPVNWPEFGDPNTEEGFRSLLAMSAYHKVRDGTAFPAVMLPHGYNDPRVAVWQSAKMAARLQRATSSGRPVLLNVDFEAGHGVGSAQRSVNAQRADLIAFLLWQFGVEGYAPVFAEP